MDVRRVVTGHDAAGIQNGTRHRWRNPGTVPAVIVGVLVGARPA